MSEMDNPLSIRGQRAMMRRRQAALGRLERISIEAARRHGDDMPRVLAAIRERLGQDPGLRCELQASTDIEPGEASESEERLQ